MGSGMYPITKIQWQTEHGKLEAAKKLIQEVIDHVGYDDSQFDNAYIDGGYSTRLEIAIEMLDDVMSG